MMPEQKLKRFVPRWESHQVLQASWGRFSPLQVESSQWSGLHRCLTLECVAESQKWKSVNQRMKPQKFTVIVLKKYMPPGFHKGLQETKW